MRTHVYSILHVKLYHLVDVPLPDTKTAIPVIPAKAGIQKVW